jgi:hypothetical protein
MSPGFVPEFLLSGERKAIFLSFTGYTLGARFMLLPKLEGGYFFLCYSSSLVR